MAGERRRSRRPRTRGLFNRCWGLLLALILLGAAAQACTRASVPIEMSQGTAPAQDEEGQIGGTAGPIDPVTDDFAVVWVPAEEALIVREAAGISSADVGRLAYDQKGILLTGSETALGSSHWVEIETQFGISGWVPRWNLTEHLDPEGVCRDPAVEALIAELTAVLESGDSRGLQQLLSPSRGLIVRLDPWNPEVRIPLDEVPGLFVDPTEIDWGARFASETPIQGSFADVVAPGLAEVFLADYQEDCNQVLTGRSPEPDEWPAEYGNFNFVSYHRPAPTDGNPFNWRTWAVAVEYVDGRPTIALLMQFRPPV